MGRFLNADELQYLQPDSINGCNLYTYCLNNPVMEVDPMGTFVIGFLSRFVYNFIVKPIVMAVATVAEGISAAINGEFDVFVDEMKALDFNNTNPDAVLKSKYVSAYKGAFVVRHGIPKLTSWSFGGTLFLNNGASDSLQKANVTTLNHEWGHYLQEKSLGTLVYTLFFALPSVAVAGYNTMTKGSLSGIYYSLPWEYTADQFGGGVPSTRVYEPWAKSFGEGYYKFMLAISWLF